MRIVVLLLLLAAVFGGCSSNVRFVQTNEIYEPQPKPKDAQIMLRHDRIKRPHTAIGIIAAELGRKARAPELDALLVKKAREVGADAIMLVEYDVDRDVYLQHHHTVVGRGPWRHHVVTPHAHVEVKRTATGIAVVFK